MLKWNNTNQTEKNDFKMNTECSTTCERIENVSWSRSDISCGQRGHLG